MITEGGERRQKGWVSGEWGEGGKNGGMQEDRKKRKKGGGEERRRKSQVACTALDICSHCHICPLLRLRGAWVEWTALTYPAVLLW